MYKIHKHSFIHSYIPLLIFVLLIVCERLLFRSLYLLIGETNANGDSVLSTMDEFWMVL